MSTRQVESPIVARPALRLWPGIAAAASIAIGAYALPAAMPQYAVAMFLGGAAGAAVILLWWLLFSRAPWPERIGAVLAIVVAAFVQKFVVDTSIAGGAMGMLSYVLAVPTLCIALVVWAAATRRLAPGLRAAALPALLLLGCVPWTLVRTDGITGGGASQLRWRWSPTAEDLLLAQARDEPLAPSPQPNNPAPAASITAAATPVPASAAKPAGAAAPAPPTPMKAAEWPGFRGPARDGVIQRVQVATDWSTAPPVQLWRRAVGPGWSSFAVRGDRFYTQEQRGEEEVVSSYRLSTGAPLWRHRDHVRFWESNGGAGPRGTPTLRDGRVYSFGATGILNSLDEATGALVWSRNVASDAKVKVPMWGFASSPLVIDDLVVIAASGKLAAYDVVTGEPRWFVTSIGGSYSSPHPATIAGVPQILLLGASGAEGVTPQNGVKLWDAKWDGSVTIVQPAVIGDHDVLITTAASSGGEGIRRLAIAHDAGKWTAEERWTSNGLKPYFNDYVLHKGYAFGFDGSILSCVDLSDGTRKWKGGRYGNGQLVLLPEQDLLLVLSEEGDLALVKATADQFTEVTRLPGVLEGKTWNHPVIVGDVLLLRNDREMAAYRLPSPAR